MVNGLRWEVIDGRQASENWDGWLEAFSDHHIRQSDVWSRHKSSSWKAHYTALFNGPTPLAMGLCLQRSGPMGLGNIFWFNAGPVFRKKRPADQDLSALKGFLEGLQGHVNKFRLPVLRLNLEIPMDPKVQLVLRQAGFRRPLMPLGTGLTYRVDLTKSLVDIRSGLERNWRNQLAIAEKSEAQVEFGRDAALLGRYLPLHNALCDRKGLKALRLSATDLERMAEELGERIVFILISAQGRTGCGGALWTFGDKGWFALSAADESGLKLNLPNLMYWRAIEHLKNSGAEQFDLTGIDPREGWGVFNFKRGLGLEPVETVGEWEWSPTDWGRRAFNLALWSFRDRMPA